MDAMDFQSDHWLQTTHFSDPLISSTLDYDSAFCDDSTLGAWDDTFCNPLTTSNKFYEQSPTSTLSDLSDNYFDFNSPNHVILPTIETNSQQKKKRSTSCEHDAYSPYAEVPKRKPGRPRIHVQRGSTSSVSSNHTTSPKSSSRTPHNQVERKYREGLNSGMERLRLAIPETARWSNEDSHLAGKPPSKAMVLACAVAYIRKVEEERDCLLQENARLTR